MCCGSVGNCLCSLAFCWTAAVLQECSALTPGIVLQRVASHGVTMLLGVACAMCGICGEVGVGGLGSDAVSAEVEVPW